MHCLSVPFSSGWALRSQYRRLEAVDNASFSSLFIGMGLAIDAPDSDEPDRPTFSSLFIGMGLAIYYVYATGAGNVKAFSSLFIGMGLAML